MERPDAVVHSFYPQYRSYGTIREVIHVGYYMLVGYNSVSQTGPAMKRGYYKAFVACPSGQAGVALLYVLYAIQPPTRFLNL